jgi:hypothetical protein
MAQTLALAPMIRILAAVIQTELFSYSDTHTHTHTHRHSPSESYLIWIGFSYNQVLSNSISFCSLFGSDRRRVQELESWNLVQHKQSTHHVATRTTTTTTATTTSFIIMREIVRVSASKMALTVLHTKYDSLACDSMIHIPISAVLILVFANQLVRTSGVLEHTQIRNVRECHHDTFDKHFEVRDVVVVDPQRVQ